MVKLLLRASHRVLDFPIHFKSNFSFFQVVSLHGLSISAICGTFLVFIVVILVSLYDCTPNLCSFKAPFTGRKVIVIFIVSFLIVSAFVSVLTICYGCLYGQKCSMYCKIGSGKHSKANYHGADSDLYQSSDEFPHILVTEATTSSTNNSSTTGSIVARAGNRTGSRTVKELQEQAHSQQEQFSWQQQNSPETIL